ncbi:hypothetical protein BS50DRAFT_159551 [Corynespora cassiicola Philippines]|uniref:Uncharacterized protein n=1 Tax=Corynespora cassiicola Philippines TaxID=1448308 RepID=A0A2T2N639_CORCC|nr:hypothetical protein BS50DRAFT_159551 [Corynespora cassiicola Philippines]
MSWSPRRHVVSHRRGLIPMRLCAAGQWARRPSPSTSVSLPLSASPRLHSLHKHTIHFSNPKLYFSVRSIFSVSH